MGDNPDDADPAILPSEPAYGGGRRHVSAVVVTVGIAILCLSGLCTTYFAGTALFGLLGDNDAYVRSWGVPILVMALAVGGPSMLIGAGIWWAGRRIRRRLKSPTGYGRDSILTTFGIVILAVAGVGSVVVIANSLKLALHHGNLRSAGSTLALILFIGGPLMFVGATMFRAGRSSPDRRSPAKKEERETGSFEQ